MFKDKTVLITGGTGSFGQKCTRRILNEWSPRKVIILSRDELKQYEMNQAFNDSRLRFFIGDVRDADRLRRAFRGVDYVIHAAALKQVPAAEYNPDEFVRTNILGAMNVIQACIDSGVKRVVALSTDKAANPANLYGATKLASDKLFVAANNMAGAEGPRFSVVRYGNVIGSRGSIVPLLERLVRDGVKEIPLTDARMTRFWISLDDGISMVFNAFKRMHGGEIYVPKIPSIKIVDLIEAMAPGIPHKVIGIRPGEKLHEIMCPKDSAHHTVEFKDHFVIAPTIAFFDMEHNFCENGLGEKGKYVADGFEYESSSNPHFLTVAELKEMHAQSEKKKA